MRLAFQILGDPVGKGRGRAVRMGSTVRVVTPKTTREYEHLVAELAAAHAIGQGWPRAFGERCAVTIIAVFARPKNRFRKQDPDGRMPRESGRIDCDNVAKAILDGLQAGGVMRNDSQVCWLLVSLWWTARDEAPCVEIEVSTGTHTWENRAGTGAAEARSVTGEAADGRTVTEHRRPPAIKGAFR